MATRSRRLLSVILSILAAASIVPEAYATGCEPPAEARARVEALDTFVLGDCDGFEDCWGDRIAAAEALVAEFPGDVLVHRTYQDQVRRDRRTGREERAEALADTYEKRYRERPDDPAAMYLYGRLASAEERAELAERALEVDPEYPWTHLALAGLRDLEPAAAETHLAKFQELCPARFRESLIASSRVGRGEFWRDRLPALRAAVAAADPALRSGYLQPLWRLEFKVEGLDRHGAVRERVREDLERLETQTAEPHRGFWTTLKAGYELLGDQEGIDRSVRGFAELDPCEYTVTKARHEDWFESRGLQVETYRFDESDADTRRQILEATDGWLTLCPGDFAASFLRFSVVEALASEGSLADSELAAEIDRLLAVWEKNLDRVRMARSPYFKAAQLLLDHGSDPARALELLDKESELVSERRSSRPLDGLPEALRGRIALSNTLQSLGLLELRAEALIVLGRGDEARELLAEIEGLLPTFEAQAAAEQTSAGAVRERRAASFELRGRLAALEKSPADAFAFLRRAHHLHPEDALAAELRELWAGLGGSDDGWEALRATEDAEIVEAETAETWKTAEEPLGEFALTDLQGKTWRPEDLHGKTALINLWATWCAPCRTEMPYLKKLRDDLAGREDVAVLTLNVDRDLGLVAPFVEKEELDLPVLLAADYVREKKGAYALPQNWIVDREGVIRRTQTGFSPEHAEEWVEDTARQLDELAR